MANPENPPPSSAPQVPPVPFTLGHMFGDMVWLMSQSPLHKQFSLTDLEWLVMPALALEQYRVFRDGERPVGLALWAFVSEEVENRLKQGGVRLRPDEWRTGDRAWLVELVAPFTNAETETVARMLTELSMLVFKGKPFSLTQTDVKTGKRRVHTIGAAAA